MIEIGTKRYLVRSGNGDEVVTVRQSVISNKDARGRVRYLCVRDRDGMILPKLRRAEELRELPASGTCLVTTSGMDSMGVKKTLTAVMSVAQFEDILRIMNRMGVTT